MLRNCFVTAQLQEHDCALQEQLGHRVNVTLQGSSENTTNCAGMHQLPLTLNKKSLYGVCETWGVRTNRTTQLQKSNTQKWFHFASQNFLHKLPIHMAVAHPGHSLAPHHCLLHNLHRQEHCTAQGKKGRAAPTAVTYLFLFIYLFITCNWVDTRGQESLHVTLAWTMKILL